MLIKAGLAGVLCNVIVGTKLEYEVSTVICGDIYNDRYPGPWLVVPDNCSRSKFALKFFMRERLWTRESQGVFGFCFTKRCFVLSWKVVPRISTDSTTSAVCTPLNAPASAVIITAGISMKPSHWDSTDPQYVWSSSKFSGESKPILHMEARDGGSSSLAWASDCNII